jgi:potassium-transporting ATPase KdpC subunit
MKLILQAFFLFVLLTCLTGIFYPLVITGLAQIFFNEKSHGSLIRDQDKIIGSSLIAQNFIQAHYFWPRPSASNFGTTPSGASNQGPASRDLKSEIDKRRAFLKTSHRTSLAEVPEDLLMASASGLDPHISIAAAGFQLQRVAHARRLNEDSMAKLQTLLNQATERRQWGIFGEPGVNVLLLNRSLDAAFGKMKND